MEFLRVCSLISALCIASNAFAMEPCATDRFLTQEPLMESPTMREGFKISEYSLSFARSVCLYIEEGDAICKTKIEDFVKEGLSVEIDLSVHDWRVAKKELLFEGSINAYVACMLDSEDNLQRRRAGELFALFSEKNVFIEKPRLVENDNNASDNTATEDIYLKLATKNDPVCQMLIGCALVAGAGCIIALLQML